MTPDKFKSIVRDVVRLKESHLSSFGESDLNALARGYSRGTVDSDGAIEKLKSIYRESRTIDEKDFDAIEKRLERG